MQLSSRFIETAVATVCSFIMVTTAVTWVHAAREESRRFACQDRMREQGIAFQQFVSIHNGFPPRRVGFNNGKPYGGWGGYLMPYLPEAKQGLEWDSRYDFFDAHNKQVAETPIATLICPTSPLDRFVEIQSQASTKSMNPDKDTVFVCRTAVSDYIASNGVLLTNSGYGLNALAGPRGQGNERQPMTDEVNSPLIKITDGLANTLLLIEQAGRPAPWRNRNKLDEAGQFGVSPNARGAWAGWGSIAFGAANRETGETPGRGDSTDCTVNCNNWFGIYSFHQDGAGVLFCDGSVRSMGTGLDPITFAQLTVRDDGNLVNLDDLD